MILLEQTNHHPQNIISIDVEDYFHVENLKQLINFSDWATYQLRVENNVDRLLEIFREQQVTSTFFVLGWVAERTPQVIRKIHQEGHEIASHGYGHRMITGQTAKEFREDIYRAKSILEEIINEKVIGYRAPTFSITRNTLWALDVLAEEGFQYDSSIFPVRHHRYGIPDWSRFIEKIPLQNSASIVEVPPLTVRFLGVNVPCGGGGYFRLAPLRLSMWAIRRFNRTGNSAILYLHPWEIDPDQPRFVLPPVKKFRHYVNLATTENKLRRLLSTGKFVTIRNLLSRQGLFD